MREEYDFSKGVRGKYSKKFQAASNLIVLSPDVSLFFKDSESVNQALRALIKAAERSVPKRVYNKKLQSLRRSPGRSSTKLSKLKRR